VTLAVTGIYHFLSCCLASRMPVIRFASITVDRKSMGRTVAERSWKDANFVCIYLYLAWRLWESAVTLAVTGNTISGRFVRHMNILVSREHRLSLTGSRWDIRWLSGSGKTPTACVFPVITVSVMGKCCDACGDGEY
jgi:hypothetical protein